MVDLYVGTTNLGRGSLASSAHIGAAAASIPVRTNGWRVVDPVVFPA